MMTAFFILSIIAYYIWIQQCIELFLIKMVQGIYYIILIANLLQLQSYMTLNVWLIVLYLYH